MLRFFANDAKGLEWNNWGSIEVHITACDCPPIREASDRYDGIPGFWTLVRDVLERTRGILFSAILALGTCLVLALSQPGRDVARAVGEGDFSTAGGQQIAFALLLLFLAVQAWLWPRMVITSNYGRDRRKWRPRWLLDWLPRVLGGLPFVIVWFALRQNPASNTGLVNALIGVGFSFFVFVIFRQELAKRIPARVRAHKEALHVGRLWVLGNLVVAIAAMVWASASPVSMGWDLGAPAVVFLGIGMIIPILVTIIQFGASLRIPTLGILIVAAVIFGNWVDNHTIGWRVPQPPAVATQDRMSLNEAFKRWSRQAPMVGDVKPLVLVASEGGASRAGYWTAEVLAALHEKTGGQLPKSLFAISSVSGGSVGAVGYVAALQDQPNLDPAKLRDSMADFAGQDFLSPTLARMLFPDLLQRFLPITALPDRAAGLEHGFEAAWTSHCSKTAPCATPDLLTRPFTSLGPTGRGTKNETWHPIVIINGASEETGRQIVTSRIGLTSTEIDADDFYKLTGHDKSDGPDIAISTAIHNGARFPWISPAGTLKPGVIPARHVVDGAYFEGSGEEVVRQLALALQQVNATAGPNGGPLDKKLKIIVVFIGYDGIPQPDRSRSVANDVLAPLVALFSSRDGHAAHLMRQLKIDASNSLADINPYVPNRSGPIPYQPILLCDQPKDLLAHPPKSGFQEINFQPPMDWALSSCAKAYMRRAAGGVAQAKDVGKVCEAIENRPIPCAGKNLDAIAWIASQLPPPPAAPAR